MEGKYNGYLIIVNVIMRDGIYNICIKELFIGIIVFVDYREI